MKRILIVNSNSININNATGITLQSIFSEIEAEKLMEIYWNENSNLNKKLKINSKVLKYRAFTFGRIFSNNKSKKISTSIKSSTENGPQRNGGLRTIIKYLRQFISLQVDLSAVKITKKDTQEIIRFKPEVIYTLGGGVASLKVSYFLSKKLNIPVVVHFMDNWRHHIQWENNPLLRGYKRKLDKYCNLCYSRSKRCIAISPKMAEVYTEETGIKHSYIMNSVKVADYICAPKENDGVINFVYAGGLHLGRNKALLDIANIIDELSKSKNKNAKLLIYTSKENADLYSKEFVHFKNTSFLPSVAHEEIKTVYDNADVLVHIESDALVGNGFFKYSISTKIPEYLATGKQMLFYGPSDIYLYSFLKENSLAVVSNNKEDLFEKIISLTDENKIGVCENAIKYAQENFDVAAAVRNFCSVLENC